jgi:biopolymer transport protein ExbD
MNRILEVCLAGSMLMGSVVAANEAWAQALQKGVSVEMAVSANATAMPEADKQDAWIIAVTADGRLYFGVEPMTAAGLADKMMRTPRNREAKLYIKADARAPFADVQKVLQAGRTVGFEAPVLLTSQPEQVAPGAIVPPKGLEVLVGGPSSGEAIVVQVLDTGETKPDVRANGADVNVDVFQYTLGRMLQNRHGRLAIVKAAGTLRFAQVAQVIDACRGAGAKVVVDGPEL